PQHVWTVAHKLDESRIIDAIRGGFPPRPDLTYLAIGDDTAHLAGPWPLVTTDAMVEQVHFDLSLMTWGDVAFRALAANLSDIAAMGGIPGPFTMALGLSEGLTPDQADDLVQGLHDCIVRHRAQHVLLVGGDVCRSATPFISITLMGRTVGAGPVGR